MRKLFYISVTLCLLAAVGCGRGVDRRLVLADTLMWTAPDSSLAILNAINRDSLQGDENRAYHALLLTQARFRVDYYDYPSDSLINTALSHYSDNHNREHYTRALLYKGAYYEVHDNPVEAMKWYKQAEDNADTTDYRNLAQINMRMGKLYYNNYASNNLDLEKFKKALKYYKIIDDKPMTMLSLSHIGNIYRESNKKEAQKCLKEAASIAIEIKDTISYFLQLSNLSMAYFLDSLYIEAKNTAMECVKNTTPTNAMLFNVANAYAALDIPDSARFYLNKVNYTDISDYDRMMVAFTKGHIEKTEGNETEALWQENYGTAISDTIKAKSKRNDILATENMIEAQLMSGNKSSIDKYKSILLAAFIIFIAVVLYLWSKIIVKQFKHKALINELQSNQTLTKHLIEENQKYTNQLKDTLEQNDTLKRQYINQIRITDYLNNYFNSFNILLQKSKILPRQNFVDEFNKTITLIGKDETYWIIIRIVADKKSGNLVSRLEKEHPSISSNELKVLCLICLGYKNDAIAASLGLEKNTVKSLKTKIKNKIGASMNLEAYIRIEMNR